GSHRQAVFRPSRRAWPRRFAPVAGRAGAAARDLPPRRGPAGHAGRCGARRQSARPLGQAALRRAHRCPAAGTRRRDRSVDETAVAAGEGLMWRLLHVIAIAALIGSAAYVYSVKYQKIYAPEPIVKTRHQIAKERDAINLLRAEFAH